MDGPIEGSPRQRKIRNWIKRLTRWAKGLLRFCHLFSYHFIRKSVVLILVVTFLLGGATVYDLCVGDGKIPEPVELGRLNPVRHMVAFNTTSHLYGVDTELSPQECWDALQPTLKILHETTPHVEAWVNEQWLSGKLKFEFHEIGYFATFDCVSRELTIYSAFFTEQDGIKASIIGHEWRHSAQSPYKFTKYILSYVFTRKLHEEIVENDAYLYEREISEAVYGSLMEREYSVVNEGKQQPVQKVARKSCVFQTINENDSTQKSP